jgi:hypothetical protein
MNEPEIKASPRKRRPWKIVGIIGAALAGILIVFYTCLFILGARRWGVMEKKTRELLVECRARNTARPVLRAQGVPGSAWEEYNLALESMISLKGSETPIVEYVIRGPKADRAAVKKILEEHLGALDHLRKGAARLDGIYPMAWEDAYAAKLPGLVSCQRLANLAVIRARFLAEEGKPREAAELILDTAQFARDVGFNQCLISEMISIAIYGVAFEDLRDLILSGKLSHDDLVEVERELEILDRSFIKTGHSLMNEAMGAGFGFLKTASSNDGELLLGLDTPSMILWFFVPKRLAYADAFESGLEILRRCADTDDRPWAETDKVGKEINAQAEQLRNPLSRIMIPGLASTSRAERERRAHLRLLRAAAHFRATGEIQELEDPLGTKLRTSKSGDHLKIWSVGRNGSDEGGSGTWKPTAEKDIVLEVDR